MRGIQGIEAGDVVALAQGIQAERFRDASKQAVEHGEPVACVERVRSQVGEAFDAPHALRRHAEIGQALPAYVQGHAVGCVRSGN